MATHKKRRATSPGPDDAAVRKHTKRRATEKHATEKHAKKKRGDKKEKEDAYAMKRRLIMERAIAKPIIVEPDLEEPDLEGIPVEKPVIKVKKIEVDDEVPRKRDTTSYNPADREMWTNPIKIEDLDLHVSHLDDSPNPAEVELARYTAALEASARRAPKSTDEEEEGQEEEEIKPTTAIPELFHRKRWINRGPVIHDINDAPQDWDDGEPDIHPLDYDAQIKRCHERIQDNILPTIFEAKIEKFEELKAAQDKMLAEREKKYPRLDLATVTRLEGLVQMRDLLAKQGEDPFEQMINIEALITAYTEGKLKWYGRGFVTYWSCGIQRSEPRGFKMEEYAALSQHFPNKSFWVEGMNGPWTEHCAMASEVQKYVDDPARNNPNHFVSYIRISVKLPYGYNYTRMTFMRDTGATFMTLYANDLQHLQRLDTTIAAVPPITIPSIYCHGYVTLTTVGGPVVMPLTVLNVCIHEEPLGTEFTSWDAIQAVVMLGSRIVQPMDGTPATIPRLDGAWPRWKLFHGGGPRQLENGTTYITHNKESLRVAITAAPLTYSYAFTQLGPMGPPIGAVQLPTTWMPGPSLLEAPDFVPTAPVAGPAGPVWTGPPLITPATDIVFPVGVPGPVPAPIPGVPWYPAAAPAYDGPSPSFWDV